jgi:hypothetical protein
MACHQMETYYEHLTTNGYVVIPFPEASREHKAFSEFPSTAPEFLHNGSDPLVSALGGFGALGIPSSFHNEVVRTLRMEVMHIVIPLFAPLLRTDPNLNLEQIIDRMMFRQPKASATAESYHRDQSPLASEGDIVLGGWINMNKLVPQFASLVPKSHTVHGTKAGGFNKIPKEEHKMYNDLKQKIIIPPFHLIVFYENIVHEVASSKENTTLLRLFTAFRITKDSHDLIPFMDDLLKDQAIMTLKSGQEPPMYACLHLVNWIGKLVEFSKQMQPVLIVDYTPADGKRVGEHFRIVKRFLGSLYENKFPMYRPYTQDEKNILKPRRKWCVNGIIYEILVI